MLWRCVRNISISLIPKWGSLRRFQKVTPENERRGTSSAEDGGLTLWKLVYTVAGTISKWGSLRRFQKVTPENERRGTSSAEDGGLTLWKLVYTVAGTVSSPRNANGPDGVTVNILAYPGYSFEPGSEAKHSRQPIKQGIPMLRSGVALASKQNKISVNYRTMIQGIPALRSGFEEYFKLCNVFKETMTEINGGWKIAGRFQEDYDLSGSAVAMDSQETEDANKWYLNFTVILIAFSGQAELLFPSAVKSQQLTRSEGERAEGRKWGMSLAFSTQLPAHYQLKDTKFQVQKSGRRIGTETLLVNSLMRELWVKQKHLGGMNNNNSMAPKNRMGTEGPDMGLNQHLISFRKINFRDIGEGVLCHWLFCERRILSLVSTNGRPEVLKLAPMLKKALEEEISLAWKWEFNQGKKRLLKSRKPAPGVEPAPSEK
ncbi:hypothetical protein C8R43DRAFT_965284 [Mycena crocata]|nr:hypothetical protein C8R43DRAFT_965284 [Mycena crocata]